LLIMVFFFVDSSVYAEGSGKIAVASEENAVTAQVSGVAARSPYFLIFDRTGTLLEVADNPYKAATRGAGSSVVPFLDQKGVTFVVAGEFGKKMIQSMTGKGIEYLEFHGSVEAALKKVMGMGK